MKELEPVTILKNNSYIFSSFFFKFNCYIQNTFCLFHFDFFLDSRVVSEPFVIILSSMSFSYVLCCFCFMEIAVYYLLQRYNL